MKKSLYTVAMQFIIMLHCAGQYNNIWMLSNFSGSYPKNGADYTLGYLDTFSLYRSMPFFITNTSLCDTAGQLLFYTNGIYISNQVHDTLFNSENFNPGYNTLNNMIGLNIDQAVVIIPNPGNSNEKIFFHEASDTVTLADGTKKTVTLSLRYSTIDMTLDSGKGGILASKKSVALITDTLIFR